MGERIRWAAPAIAGDSKQPIDIPALLKAGEAGEFLLDGEKPPHDLSMHNWLRKELEGLRNSKRYSHLFRDVGAVSVSAIGLVVDRKMENGKSDKYLKSLRRKQWGHPVSEDGVIRTDRVVDFIDLFSSLFTGPARDDSWLGTYLTVRNDAAAKAIAEWRLFGDKNLVPFVYVLIHSGMNAGVVSYGGNEYRNALHPEFGHVRPSRHPDDKLIDAAHSGCPVHDDCYEGICSGLRLERRYGTADLPKDHEAWDFMSYYTAQACLTLTMMLAPRKIIVGGCFSNEYMLAKIVRHFDVLNNGYSSYTEMDDPRFISIASMPLKHFDILAAVYSGLAETKLTLIRGGRA
jgi:hypothetical protein